MSTTQLLDLFTTFLEQHQGLGYFVNISIKSTVILLLACAINYLLRKYSAAARHLIACVTFISLLFLPTLIALLPTIELTFFRI